MAFTSDGRERMDIPESATWYHGSPFRLDILRASSSITRNRALAEAFSHRPTALSYGNDGIVEHNGLVDGYLYAVDELTGQEDIRVHPACRDDDPWEWTTSRDLRLRLIEVLPIPKKSS